MQPVSALPQHAPQPVAQHHAITILLVEDNQGDVRLVHEALTGFHDSIQVPVAGEGQKALRMLQEANPKPDLILLDLNLPGMDGRSLLSRIKSDPKLRRIPVIVLTSSAAPRDVRQAYDMHANCYLVKPPLLRDFEDLIRGTVEFWTRAVRLPGQ